MRWGYASKFLPSVEDITLWCGGGDGREGGGETPVGPWPDDLLNAPVQHGGVGIGS